MDLVNAIAKARFSSAKPQRIQLHKGDGLVVDLLCLESGQKIAEGSGLWSYYVITGTADLTEGGETVQAPTGQLVTIAPPQSHTIANVGEGRLVVLATGPA